MNGVALCAGVGGIELGLSLAIGSDYRCICYVEREAYAVSVLMARMGDETLDQAPIWDDVSTFDGKPWRGKVDIISTGFPCQPWSSNGQHKGFLDERWIWPSIARIIGEVAPEWVFIENVPELVGDGLGAVLQHLCDIGYDAEWDIIGANTLGAAHIRRRLFLLAHSRCKCTRHLAIGLETDARASHVGESSTNVATRTIFPPRPDDELSWRQIAEQYPMLSVGIEPTIRGMVDGDSPQLDRCRTLGNAVIPIVAATAYHTLRARFDHVCP